MRVAIAGGSGFVGRHLAPRLRADGHVCVLLARGRASCPPGQVDELRRVDLAGDPAAVTAALTGCDAVVNLVGIKTARGQSFAAAHVESVTRLISACAAAGVARLIHVSVAGSRDDPRRPYLASKWQGEQIVRASPLAWTIVRPGVIHGVGDDFVTQLAAMLRHAAVFPAPGGGRAPLQPVAVEDVADAIAAALRKPETAGQCLDVVGPESLPLRAWVDRVAATLGLRVWQAPAPIAVLMPAVAAMEALLPAPPLTRAQLGLLAEGVTGELADTRSLLDAAPRPLTPARIRELASDIGPWLGVSLRLVHDERARTFLAACRASAPRLWAIVPLAATTIALLRAYTPDIWRCMLIANVILIPTALLSLRLPWRALLRPRLSHLAFGTAAAAALYGLGWLGAQALRAASPALMAQVGELYAWGTVLPLAGSLPLLLLIVCGEEVFWRAGVALPVAGRFGPWWGCFASAAAFTLAHLYVGPPVLWLAAFACGLVWAWMVVRTRSLIPGIVCHYLWDVGVMFVAPY